MDVDKQTSEAIEIVSEGARLSANLLKYVLTNLADRLEDDKQKGNRENTIINRDTKDGKQRINDLMKKHESGIQSLDDNLTKQQVKDYQKEFKKLGVDFSISKNDKDSYSFFFAADQANVIEKGINNVNELKSKVAENEKVKEAKLELDSELDGMSEEEVENANEAYSKYVDRIEGEEKIPEKENLSEKEKELFDKIKDLDETEKDVQSEIQKDEKDLSKEEIEFEGKEINTKEERLDYVYSNLSKDEKDLFKQINKKDIEDLDNSYAERMESRSYIESEKYSEMAENLSPESVDKVNNLYNENITPGNLPAKETFIEMGELNKVEKNLEEIKEKEVNSEEIEDTKEEEVNSEETEDTKEKEGNSKEIKEDDDKDIDDKHVGDKESNKEKLNERISDLNEDELDLLEKRMEYENEATAPAFDASKTYKLADDYKEAKSKHSQETIDKINNLDKDIRDLDNFSEESKGSKMNANEILKNTKEQKEKRRAEPKKETTKTFSIDNVKNLDKKAKEESQEKGKDERSRGKEVSL